MSPALSTDESGEIRERIAVLETRVSDMGPKIDEMYEIIVQGRGVAKVGRAGAAIIGTCIASALGLLAIKGKAFLLWLGS